MVRLAVTGGIACGKSTVASVLAARGIPVCEADALAHDLMRPGQPVYDRVVEAFGRGILDGKGEIDRDRLGARVFSDEEERARLNERVHPGVVAAWTAWLDGLDRAEPVAAVVVPLLHEVGAHGGWDAVICVAAREETQLRRLQERGLSREQAVARVRAQWPVARKMVASDYVILNEGSLMMLEEQTMRIIRRVLEN